MSFVITRKVDTLNELIKRLPGSSPHSHLSYFVIRTPSGVVSGYMIVVANIIPKDKEKWPSHIPFETVRIQSAPDHNSITDLINYISELFNQKSNHGKNKDRGD